MGAGKTTFVQGILDGLMILENATSPTFVIVNKYDIPQNRFSTPGISFCHADLYRLDNAAQAIDLGFNDIFADTSIAAVEWPEKIDDILPKNVIKVRIDMIDENTRSIDISGAPM